MIGLFVALIPLTIFLVGGLFLIVILVRSKSPVARTFGWLCAGFATLMPVLAVMLFTLQPMSRSESHSQQATLTRPSPSYTAQLESSSGHVVGDAPFSDRVEFRTEVSDDLAAAWSPEAGQEFEADIYPTDHAAIEALGLRATETIRSKLTDASPKGRLYIPVRGDFDANHDEMPDGGIDRSAVLRQIAAQCRAKFPAAVVSVQTSSDELQELAEEDARVFVDVMLTDWSSEKNAKPTRADEPWSGTFEVTVLSPSENAVHHSARFVDKPWVESMREFEATRPNGKFVVAKSRRFTISEAAARARAEEAAIAMVVDTRGGEAIANAIRSGDLITDRFSQRLSASYGDVWREAILIDVTPARLTALQRVEKVAEARALTTVTGRLLGFASLMIIATVLYFMLNLLTRGYYRLPIGMIVGTCVVLVVLSAMFLWTWNRVPSGPLPLESQSALSL